MSENTELKGKVALVTGAGEGIGKATAKLFAEQGASVGVLGRTKENISQTVEEIESAGGKALAIVADVADASDMENAVKSLTDEYGRLDIVFANAGINGITAPIEEIKPEEWRETIDNNLTGTFLTVKYAVPHLKENGGSVIITASINGKRYFANPGATAYSSSKAGQVAFAQCAALELAQYKIRVNVVCPGAIDTNIKENQEKRDLEEIREPVETPEGDIPLTDGTPGKSEQVAELVLFLASDRASHITGTPVWIDGAQSLLI
jgi:NAD(P)-dependent dehydrogenase (short-subunit alcohol dehydrogenase family)